MTTYPNGIVKSLLPSIDAILGVRDSIGAIIQPVYLVTRQWYTDIGLTTPASQPEGYAKDTVVQLLPSPGMKSFNQDVRLREGGAIKAGDIVLTGVSRNKYQQCNLDGTTPNKGVELLYMLGQTMYQVINVTQKYVTFDVQIRELTDQQRY